MAKERVTLKRKRWHSVTAKYKVVAANDIGWDIENQKKNRLTENT